MFDLKAYAMALVALLFVAGITWLLSMWKRDVSIVDSLWSLMFLVAAFVYYESTSQTATRAAVVLVLVLVWSLRLFLYITWRNWGSEEDFRYREIRKRNEPGFALKSCYLIFGFQAVVAWVVSMPLLAAINSSQGLGWLDLGALFLWCVGMVFESVGDWQLAKFKADPQNRKRVLSTGLWRYTRHPNYFGNACIWWGFFGFGLAAGGWWAILSPILMTFLLLRFSGVALLEKDIQDRRPAYREYVAQTNTFFPGPPTLNGQAKEQHEVQS